MGQHRMPITRRLGRIGAVIGSQAVSSITNFAVNALALASGDIASYGRFAISFQVCQLMITLAHGSIGETTLVHTSAHPHSVESRRLRNGAASLCIVIGAALSLPLLGASFIDRDLRTGLIIAAVGSPFMLPQYVYRAQVFAAGRPGRALASDTVWLAVVAIGGVCGLTVWDATPNGHLAVWLVGGAIAGSPAILGALTGGPGQIRALVDRAGPQMIRLGAESFMARIAVFVALVALQVAGEDAAAGALATALMLFSPLGVVLSAVSSFVVPREVRRHGIHVVRPVVPAVVSAVLGTITLGWAAMLYLINEFDLIGGPLDLERNLVSTRLLLAMTLHFLGMSVWRGAMIALRINDAAAESMRARSVGTAAQLTLPIVGVALSGVTWGTVGLAVGTMIGGLDIWRRYARMRRSPVAV
ncbi:MAG: hypothetical protein R2707_16300 [Acidimicrobiales bacterium]